MLLIPAFYLKNVTDDGVIAYRNVIEQTGDDNFKFLLYNIPQYSGVTINFNIIENLLNLYPQKCYEFKDSTGNIDTANVTKYFNDFCCFLWQWSNGFHTSRRGGALVLL